MRHRSIIVLEANEVPFKIFDHFCARQPGSALARIFDRSSQYLTHSEDRARFIMPWTTWPSMHRGVHDEVHQIFKFGQWEIESDRRYPPIWDLLVRNKIRAGVFSSMQSAPLPSNREQYSFYVPDMFSTDTAVVPQALEPLQSFNLAMTRESGRNVSRRINLGAGSQVLMKSGALGIRVKTYLDIAKQLASEFIDESRKTRRRAYQPLLMFDAFFKQLQDQRPQFCTFFTNHVAAAMHRYWAAAFPQDYERFDLDNAWVEKYRGEIDFAMSKLDAIAGRLASFVDRNPDYALVIATSMGQAAIPASHVKEFLTITDIAQFMKRHGIELGEYEERPAMVPDFSFRVQADKANAFEASLNSLAVDGNRTDYHRDNDFFHVSFYNEKPGISDAKLHGKRVTLSELGLGYLVHEDEVSCTAQHIPEGVLAVYSPHADRRATTQRMDVSALEFAPAVLEHFGVEVPAYMRKAHEELSAAF